MKNDLCKKVKNKKGKIYLDKNIFIKHEGASSVSKKNIFELEKNRNWHWMWSTFIFIKNLKVFLALLIIYLNCFRNTKTFFYFLVLNNEKRAYIFAD